MSATAGAKGKALTYPRLCYTVVTPAASEGERERSK